MNVTTRSHSASRRSSSSSRWAGSAHGPGRTHGGPAADSEITLQHLGAAQRVCVLGFGVYSIKYIRCSSTEVLNKVMQTRRRTQAPNLRL